MRFHTVEYVLSSLSRYWPGQTEFIRRLPVAQAAPSTLSTPPSTPPVMEEVSLPEWAKDVGVNGCLLVPQSAIVPASKQTWRYVDWFEAAFWYLSGAAEQTFESNFGVIGSNSHRLKKWDIRIWEKAWVNRIALMLRRWAARESGSDEHLIFGTIPDAEIILTHDLDAIRKTPVLRCKQTASRLLNAIAKIRKNHWAEGIAASANAITFFFQSGQYDRLEKLMELEQAHQIRSMLFIYTECKGKQNRHWAKAVVDPSPYIHDRTLLSQLDTFSQKGWPIGLHPSYASYDDPVALQAERICLEKAMQTEITQCRQHWLRFSWDRTWRAQQTAGLTRDFSLGFNDREGFRNGAALEFSPWDKRLNRGMKIQAIPLVLMDSQVSHDTPCVRDKRINDILEEVIAVGGQASVLWHTHVLSPDFGWGDGYRTVLSNVTSLQETSNMDRQRDKA